MRREAIGNKSSIFRLLPVGYCLVSLFFLSACESEVLRQQEQEIQRLQAEIERHRKEVEEMKLARQKEERKRQDCNRAFRNYFEKAQGASDPHEAVSLYHEGLRLCPDDDVAHYELARILERLGRAHEAEKELEAALRINPDFQDARRRLKALKGSRD